MRSMLAAVFAVCVPFTALSHTVDLSVSDDAFRLAYEGGWRRRRAGCWWADVGALHNGDDGDLIHLGLKVRGDVGGNTVGVEGLGRHLVYGASLDKPDEDVSARWHLPANCISRPRNWIGLVWR